MPSFQGRGDFIRYVGRAWWSDKFCSMQRPGHRFTYRDVLGGNFSISAELFASLGGFDPAISGPGGEDYEFGARLIKANVGLRFAGDAIALYHEHETTDVGRSLRRAREEARADVLLGRKHPELRPTLPLVRFQHPYTFLDRIVHSLAYRYSWLGDSLATFLRWMLEVLEQVKLRGLWRRIFTGLQYYWYLRGAADELGSPKALAKFLQGGPACTDQGGLEIEIDLNEGLETAEQTLDEVRPSGVRLRFREHIIGRIPSQAGAEPLRGEHLRPVLATDLATPLLTALALEEARGKEIRQIFPGHVVQTLGVGHASEGH